MVVVVAVVVVLINSLSFQIISEFDPWSHSSSNTIVQYPWYRRFSLLGFNLV